MSTDKDLKHSSLLNPSSLKGEILSQRDSIAEVSHSSSSSNEDKEEVLPVEHVENIL